MSPLHLSCRRLLEALGSARVRFQFRHNVLKSSCQLSAVSVQPHLGVETPVGRALFAVIFSAPATTRAWRPAAAVAERFGWAHFARQLFVFLLSVFLSLVPYPTSSAPESRAACCPLAGAGTPRCSGIPRP